MMEKEKNRFQMYADAAAAKLAKKRQFPGAASPGSGAKPGYVGKTGLGTGGGCLR